MGVFKHQVTTLERRLDQEIMMMIYQCTKNPEKHKEIKELPDFKDDFINLMIQPSDSTNSQQIAAKVLVGLASAPELGL